MTSTYRCFGRSAFGYIINCNGTLRLKRSYLRNLKVKSNLNRLVRQYLTSPTEVAPPKYLHVCKKCGNKQYLELNHETNNS
jgi:hypothetical protein